LGGGARVGHRRIVKKGQGGASLQSKTGGQRGGEGWKRGPTYKTVNAQASELRSTMELVGRSTWMV
jgi:hypothetical protein